MSDDNYKEQSEKVALYYDQWQSGYDEVYGDVIQAFRPGDTNELIKYIVSSADLNNGQVILDAGCGVGGPAIWIAKNLEVKISAVTLSQVQADQAGEAVNEAHLQNKIDVFCLDYHELTNQFKPEYFDRALFLESLGHAGAPDSVIAETYAVLKPGGIIYIKDFYYKEPSDPDQKGRIERTIKNINHFYEYKTLSLTKTLAALRAVGFEIEFIKKFNFKDDISIRMEFERQFNIDIFGGEPEFAPAEWLEIKCVKPAM